MKIVLIFLSIFMSLAVHAEEPPGHECNPIHYGCCNGYLCLENSALAFLKTDYPSPYLICKSVNATADTGWEVDLTDVGHDNVVIFGKEWSSGNIIDSFGFVGLHRWTSRTEGMWQIDDINSDANHFYSPSEYFDPGPMIYEIVAKTKGGKSISEKLQCDRMK